MRGGFRRLPPEQVKLLLLPVNRFLRPAQLRGKFLSFQLRLLQHLYGFSMFLALERQPVSCRFLRLAPEIVNLLLGNTACHRVRGRHVAAFLRGEEGPSFRRTHTTGTRHDGQSQTRYGQTHGGPQNHAAARLWLGGCRFRLGGHGNLNVEASQLPVFVSDFADDLGLITGRLLNGAPNSLYFLGKIANLLSMIIGCNRTGFISPSRLLAQIDHLANIYARGKILRPTRILKANDHTRVYTHAYKSIRDCTPPQSVLEPCGSLLGYVAH